MIIGDVKRIFGTAVRNQRNGLHMSQEELAGRAGLHRTYISDVERGARNVSLESINGGAAAVGVSLSVLLSLIEEMASDMPSNPALTPIEPVGILMVEDSTENAGLAGKT